ncbi:adhesion G protein-coupled receptor L3 [Elysia marginata]|uniref:Adhesion G protein-coupled receptor L3 n=1 Tax=Elysia marginata TaxID=1093978 RepID=A0AAV4GGY9_9GAST|nr:adhesion G protein-coupled receptor L3 [Elysia marginata]
MPPTVGPVFIPPLSLLLGISRKGQQQLPTCSNITWWDKIGECQPALCPPGKLIDESGKCLSAIDQIRGLGYKLFLVLRPRKPQMVTPEDIQSLSNHISAAITDISLESITDIRITVWHQDLDLGYGKLRQITVSSFLVGNDTIGRDEYEDQLLSHVSGAWSISRANGTQGDIEMKVVLIGEELREFEETDNEDVEEDIDLPLPDTQLPRFAEEAVMDAPPSATVTTTTASTTAAKPRKIMYKQRHMTRLQRANLWRLKHLYIDVTHSLACPSVPVNISNTSTSMENLPKMSFLFLGETVKIRSTQNIAMVKGQVQLCTSVYKKLTSPVLMRTKQSVLEQVQYYLEVVCVSLSVTCLLFSSFTYCLFPSLRSLPGMSNLSLCLSLAVAQVCLLITARWGVNQRLPQGYCLAHAVLLHYSWLASFAWMSVCCIHMFRVFTAHDNKFSDNRSDKKRYFHYCIYGFGMPALVVIATYAINASVTNGRDSGYNSDICFLDTRQSTWTLALSLLAPLCLVILTNGVMFVLTVKEIVHVSSLQEHRRSRGRQGVLTYVKLSTLTGLLGAIVVIAVQLNNSVVSLLTSPLMALQGVFIFVSFTCNERVRRLYQDLFRRLGLPCATETEKATSTGSTAVRTSSSNPSKSKTAITTIGQ